MSLSALTMLKLIQMLKYYAYSAFVNAVRTLTGSKLASGHATRVNRGTATVSEVISTVKSQVSTPLMNAL